MRKDIRCHGRVVSTDGSRRVEVVMHSGSENCPGCAASILCGSKGSVVTAYGDLASKVEAGDEVELAIAESARWRSIAVCLALPCLLLLGGFWAAMIAGVSEMVGAAVALVSVVGYFGVLYLIGDCVGGGRWEIKGVRG